MYQKYGKRALDFVLSLGGLVCLSWLLLGLAAAIKLDSPGPVFFKQKRVGIHKTHFEIYKFRTMRADTPHDMPTHLLADPATCWPTPTSISPGWGASCAGPAWTNCPSCGTS